MNKNEFIRIYADNLGITMQEAETNIDNFIDSLTKCLKSGDYVHISGFGSFELTKKEPRLIKHPNGSIVKTELKYTPTLKFTKTYKEQFNMKK